MGQLSAGVTYDAGIAAWIGWTRTDHEGGLWVEPGTGRYVYELPGFSTDPATSGPLLTALADRGWHVECTYQDGRWLVTVRDGTHPAGNGYADTLPFALTLAIRAALKE